MKGMMRMWWIKVGMRGIRVGIMRMHGIRVGMRGIAVGMREIRVGMQGIGGRNAGNQGVNLRIGVEFMNKNWGEG